VARSLRRFLEPELRRSLQRVADASVRLRPEICDNAERQRAQRAL
jgi:hypothetical protein